MILLDAIQCDFRDADTIPSWNDAQTGPRFPLLYLDRAADLAATRGLQAAGIHPSTVQPHAIHTYPLYAHETPLGGP